MDVVFSVDEKDAGTRLDVYLAHCSGLSRSRVKKLIDEGCAALSDGSALKSSYHIRRDDVIAFTIPPVSEPAFLPEKIPLDIIFQDNHIIVVNKPPGMVVHPGRGNVTGTLASALLYHCKRLSTVGGPFRPGIVHRLDMNTSGLMIVALSDGVHRVLARMIQNHEIIRTYTAFVWGHPKPESGTIEAPVGRHHKKPTLQAVVEQGRPAITHYETVNHYEFLSKLSITLHTGRTHQIRVHMASIGHHVFGDPSYGGREERFKGFSPEIRLRAAYFLKHLKRQALHAGRLEFTHPMTGKGLCFEVPLPDDMRELEKALDER